MAKPLRRFVAVALCLFAGIASADPAKLKELDAAIEKSIAAANCPGAVLLLGKDNAIVYEKAYGSAAVRPTTRPARIDTIYDLASLSKSVGCAPSVMLLAERGKLKITDPVAKYLPEFAANGKEAITIEQLLLHQAGMIPDNAMADYANGPDEAIKRILALKPQKTPGTAFIYSDVHYLILGRLVQTIDGRPLDKFAREEIFLPAGMSETMYNPPEALKPRCAPTQQRNGHWMQGEVHDPRSFALGGVAGHAGVFSTAHDLSRFCRMILAGGVIDGKRVLAEATIAEMTRPRSLPDGTNWRTCGFDVDTPYSGCRGDRFEARKTFGHTGFTGTMFWLDPANKCYVILLTNSVHPEGKGNVLRLRKIVSTLAAQAMLD